MNDSLENRTPALSIVMPVYNVVAYLSRAIESVLAQSFADWELLVVIDGSPDNCEKIARGYADADSRVRVFVKENGGVSEARNHGLRVARGQWVHFFDSDDWLSPEFYETMLERAQGFDILISGYTVDYNGKNEVACSWNMLPQNPHDTVDFINRYICFLWNKLFKRDFLCENDLTFEPGLNVFEDSVFMANAINRNPYIDYITATRGYHYSVDNTPSLTRKFDGGTLMAAMKSLESRKSMINYFIADPGERLVALEYAKYIMARTLLHALYSYGDANKRQWVKKILNAPVMHITRKIPQTLSLGMKDKFLWRLIGNRKTWLLSTILWAKHLSKRK